MNEFSYTQTDLPSDILMSEQICLLNQIMTAFMSTPWQLNENNSERPLVNSGELQSSGEH